ncbi:MAG: heme-degrading domain-containing protein [Anaerolineales bacterium]|nr:heme-degrading domain-containing protein [Anaerolineales bacterium]
MDDILVELLQEEQELQFTNFNEATAWQIGSQMAEHAMRENIPVTIDIQRGAHQLFHASMRGTAADNDEWVKRKVRLVNRFGHSSFYMGQLLKSKGRSIEESYLIPESEFAAHGGCFPIFVKGTGMVGTITVSGLPQEEDHKLVVESIRTFLAKEK